MNPTGRGAAGRGAGRGPGSGHRRRQVVEANIVRGRGVRRKKRGGEKERQTSALESMRISAGRGPQKVREGRGKGIERDERNGMEPAGEEEAAWRNEEVRSVQAPGGEREEWKCKRTDYPRREPRGPRGARLAGACAAGVGKRARVQTVPPLLLFRSIRPAVLSIQPILLPRTFSVPLPHGPRGTVSSSFSRSGGPRPCLPLSFASSLDTSGRGSPITAEWPRSKAPRA